MAQNSKYNLATIVALVSLLTTALNFISSYYGNKQAFKDAISDVRTESAIKFEQLKGQDKIHDLQIAQLGEAVKAATTYIGTGARPQ